MAVALPAERIVRRVQAPTWTVISDAGLSVWRIASDGSPEVGGLFVADDGSEHVVVGVDAHSRFVDVERVEDVTLLQAAE